MLPQVKYTNWGLIDYKEAWDRQTALQQEFIHAKRNDQELSWQGALILCEHPAVYTLGKSGSEDHLLIGAAERAEKGLGFYKINRGGDITHHGPGQVVGYPILDLEYWYRDVHRYVRNIEEVIIRVLRTYQIEGIRLEGYTGVWTKDQEGIFKKVCAIGVHMSRWVSMHGFALNVNNDLNLFEHIVPCGIKEEGMEVTSIKKLTNQEINMTEINELISATFASVFNCRITHNL